MFDIESIESIKCSFGVGHGTRPRQFDHRMRVWSWIRSRRCLLLAEWGEVINNVEEADQVRMIDAE